MALMDEPAGGGTARVCFASAWYSFTVSDDVSQILSRKTQSTLRVLPTATGEQQQLIS